MAGVASGAGHPAVVAVALASLAWLAALLLLLVGRPLATDDTWWHLVMGALYAGGDLWPRQDPLLHTTVLRAPVPHEWLFQVVLHAVREAFGFAGLRVLHTAGVAAVLVLAWRAFRRASGDAVAAALATCVLVGLCWFRLMQLRPDVVSVLAVLVLYAAVLRAPAGPSARSGAAGLLLLLLWVNAHSVFAVGLALVVAALLGALLEAGLARASAGEGGHAALARARRLALFGVAAVLVTGLNPRGFDQHATFFTESGAGLIWRIRDDFLPWRPWSLPDPPGLAFTKLAWVLCNLLFAAFFAAAALRARRWWRRRDAASLAAFDAVHFGLGAAACVASLVAVRFHWLAFFPLLYLLRPLAREPWSARARMAACAACLGLAAALPWSAGAPAFRSEVAREPRGYAAPWLDVRYCGEGERFLADAGLEGRLYHPFNLGGFLGYWLAPRLRTFIDGRLDHVPAEVLDDYLAIRRTSLRGPTAPLRERLDRWGVDVFFADTFPEAWYPDRESGYHLRRLPEWSPVFVTRTHAVHLRRNPRNRANWLRVARYWSERSVPFDPQRGFDAARVVREAPAWAREHGLVLPDEEALEARAADPEAPERSRAAALEALAAHAWRVGRFARQVELDRALRPLRGASRERDLRLADGLLQTGRPRQALAVLRPLARERPEDRELRWWVGRAEAALEGP